MSTGIRSNEEDEVKAFLSRVPTNIDDDALLSILKEEFGEESVVEVETVKEKQENGDDVQDDGNKASKRRHFEQEEPLHKGFAFIKFYTKELRNDAIEKGAIRWQENNCDESKKKKKHRTMYIRPIVRDTSENNEKDKTNSNGICYLWKLGRCTHGDSCKFAHVGEGSCVPNSGSERKELSYGEKMKKRKCFTFKKTGKCKAGDACLFSHDFEPKIKNLVKEKTSKGENNSKTADDKSLKDCINWKTKGKCRKGENCPFKHDPTVREKALQKKGNKQNELDSKKKRKESDKAEKERQPLSVRVFGLNYDTTEQQVRDYFADCGPIVELTFPTFEDSGRSKGFCGILFQSPKAVEKAVALDGLELDGRWLRIQAGKMYLRQWEENIARVEKEKEQIHGEFGQKVKRRKKHGFGSE